MKFLIVFVVAAVLNVNGATVMKLSKNEAGNNVTTTTTGVSKERYCLVEKTGERYMMLCTTQIATEVKSITHFQGKEWIQFKVRQLILTKSSNLLMTFLLSFSLHIWTENQLTMSKGSTCPMCSSPSRP